MRNVHLIVPALFAAFGILRVCPAQDGTVVCATCHSREAGQLARSIHASLRCQDCHDGEEAYALSPAEARKYLPTSDRSPPAFNHGSSFSGKPARSAVPVLCGTCHADIERMNPYGLRTDQLARYWTSGHGKTLRDRDDDRVAVCIDCHGTHDILPGRDSNSSTFPLNVPDTCATCHADAALMTRFGLPVEIVDEYRQSVHGRLLLERGDTGAPTCATCHGNHSAMPPGFSTVGAVCGQCHQHVAMNFSKSIHARQPEHKGCVQCHGGGPGRHFHHIERITKPTGVLIERYAHLLATEPAPTPEQVTEAIHPNPRKIMEHVLPTCTECHDDIEDDESLPRLFVLLDKITEAERRYVQTARRLNGIGQGVLLVDAQRFKFEEARTHLIELAPLQHTLDNSVVAEKVDELNAVCAHVNADLDELENGLRWRHRGLIPVWLVALVFAGAIHAKYKKLKALYVKPLPQDSNGG